MVHMGQLPRASQAIPSHAVPRSSSWRQRSSRSSSSPWSALPTMAPGTSSMLRARRRDVNVKPNRRLDRSSTRGMIYENEELRLRTINISAEVERGQDDIKKLRRENDALRRELWGLRDEYDKLEALLKKNEAYLQFGDSDGEKDDDEEGAAGSECSDSEESGEEEVSEKETNPGDESQSKPKRELEFDLLSIVPEETDENQTDSQQSQDDTEQQKSPGAPRRMYGYPVVDPLTGRPCGVMLPVDEASAAAAVAEISGAVDDVFLQPRGGPDVFVEGAYSMESTAMSDGTTDGTGPEYSVKSIPAEPSSSSPIIIVSNEDTPALATVAGPTAVNTPVVADTPAPDTLLGRSSRGATLRERRKSTLTLQMPVPVTQTVQSPEEAACEDPCVTTVYLTGVPNGATDAQVLAGLAPFGAVLAPIERPAGPSGDERIVRLRRQPQQRGALPQDVTVAGTRVPLRVLDSSGTRDKTINTGKPFRTQLQVRLKTPAATLPLRRIPSIDASETPGALPRASSANPLQNPPPNQPAQVTPAQAPASTTPPQNSNAIPVLPRSDWPALPRHNQNILRRPFAPGRAVPVPILPATAPVTVPVAVPGAGVSNVTAPRVPVQGVTVPVVPVPIPVTVHGDTVAVAAPVTATDSGTVTSNGVTNQIQNGVGLTNQNGAAVTNHNGSVLTNQNGSSSSHQNDGNATAQNNNPSINNAINEAVEKSQERLEVPETPGPASATTSPSSVRRNTKRNLLRKQSSEESHSTLPTPSPGQARRKLLRNCKTSSGAESTASCSTPSANNNTASRLGAPPSPPNPVADHSQSSSSGQDSPHKDRRRRVSIYLSRRPKKSVGSQHLLNSGGSGDGGGDGSPYEHGATTSERERTASASSRDSTWNSRPGPPRRTERRDSADSGKVPWCGCWGNGCL